MTHTGMRCIIVAMKRVKIPTIAVILRLSFASHRDMLIGISHYAKVHHWRMRLINAPENFTPETLSRLHNDGIDGIISYSCGTSETAQLLLKSQIPLVMAGAKESALSRRKHSIGFIRIDDVKIGRLGARYLTSLGRFRSFGFLPENVDTPCSSLRRRGFAEEIRRRFGRVYVYQASRNVEDGSADDLASLEAWIKHMPKPAAIMAVYDMRATHLLEAAHDAGLHVPSQLSVISVDNDQLLCDFTEPSLSSIAPDHIKIGEMSAAALDRLMKPVGRRKGALTIQCEKVRIVERESSAPIAPGAAIVNAATAFIRKNALNGISPRDVVASLGVSRRLAELRYRESTGESMMSTILSIRLEALKEQLSTTSIPIGKATANCGFRNENYAKAFFKSRVGMSMRAYRLLKGSGTSV